MHQLESEVNPVKPSEVSARHLRFLNKMRERRRMYSSGDDSWEEDRRSRRHHDKLQVPGSRSRSNTPSSSSRKSVEKSRYESGKRSPYNGSTSSKTPRSSARQELSPREISKFEKRKAYSPSKDIRSSGRGREDQKAADSYARFGSPRSRKSSGRSRGRSPNYEDLRKEKSHTRVDYGREKSSPREDYIREKSPRRERRDYSPHYRRDSPEEIEKYRPRKHYTKYETEYTDSMTESPEEYERKSSKQREKEKRESNAETVILEPREEKKSSVAAVDKSEVDYENYSPSSKNVQEKSQWGRNSPLSRIAAIEAEDSPVETNVSPVKEILVEPAPEPTEKLYSSQLKMVEDSNNFLVAMPEDDGDSGIGFNVSDYQEEADFKQLSIPKQETPRGQEPKLWTLLSFSPTGPFKVRDDETGEIFTVINEFPVEEPEESNEVVVNENDKILDDEDDVGWCSLYLISRVLGLGLLCAGIAGMVLIALQK